MSFKLGKQSLKNIDNIHPYLKIIVKKTIEISEIDFGILNTGGMRTAEMQNEIFKNGNSKCDGYIKKSYHQSGKAVDLVPYVNGKYTWTNKNAFIKILKAWEKAENELKIDGIIPDNISIHHGIYWNWKDLNMDGELDINDRVGFDCAHHEIRTKPQKI